MQTQFRRVFPQLTLVLTVLVGVVGFKSDAFGQG